MKHTETVEISGHLMDTGVLARVLDDVLEYGGDYKIDRLDVGKEHDDESYARISVGADDADGLQRILMRVQTHGVNPVDAGEARLEPAPADGVFPEDFYSTTNLETVVRLAGQLGARSSTPRWTAGWSSTGGRVRTVPVSATCGPASRWSAARPGCGSSCRPPTELQAGEGFGFMSSVGVQREAAGAAGPADRRSRCARSRRPARRCSGSAARRSCTPARRRRWWRWSRPATSTCSSPATRWPPTTSRPRCTARRWASTSPAAPASTHGHEHHIRAINPIRRAGSIAAAVEHGRAHRRRHARAGRGTARTSCWSARSATTARCPTSTPT